MTPKTQKELKEVISKIIRHYRPEKIILFGSQARGKGERDSDFDLFIIKRTKEDFFSRIQKVEELLWGRKIPLDILVYTPEQVKRRLAMGDFFVEEILDNGKILYEKK